MKQKIVIKVPMNCTKSLKIAVGVPGVESAAFGGQDKSQIELTGDCVDPVKLTTLLRKKLGFAELVSVEEKKEEKKDNPKVEHQPLVCHCGGGITYCVCEVWEPNRYYYPNSYCYYEDSCSIQ